MSSVEGVRLFGRRLFGATKRPMWEIVHALTGRRLQATTTYFDLGRYGGYFEVPASALRERLPPGFEAVQHRPGWTELDLFCAEYRKMDILKPYNELGIFAPVRFSGSSGESLEGLYTMYMPVTTEEARWGGVENYGFPKVIGDIYIEERDGREVCTVHQGGVHVLTLRVDRVATRHFEQRSVLLNVRHDGVVTRGAFDVDGELGEAGVSLELGPHAFADQLRQMLLRTDSARGYYVPRARATLHEASELGLLPARIAAPAVAESTNGRKTEARPG